MGAGAICFITAGRGASMPSWCRWVPTASRQYVADCQGNSVQGLCSSWCQWIPYASQHYVAECAGCGGLQPRVPLPCSSWCQWVPTASQQYVTSCGGCSPGVTPLPVYPPIYPPSTGISPGDMCCSNGCGTNGWIGWKSKEAYCPVACAYCYGHTVDPSAGVSSGNMCCTDGCGTNGWIGWTVKAAYCPYACAYCFRNPMLTSASTGSEQKNASLNCESSCGWVPKLARQHVSNCSGCSPSLPEQLICESWCQKIPTTSRANITDCGGCSTPDSDTFFP